MRLVVAEKPSVARDLAKVLGVTDKREGHLRGDGLIITWCVGHLVELEDPVAYDPAWKRWSFDTLPMLPERFALRPRTGAKDQWKVVRDLLKSREVDEVVNACDAGREGELIFRNCYDLAGCRLPVWRLWVSSMTREALLGAWRSLRPGERYDGLADAARCRSEADWLVGLNATRALTLAARGQGGDTLFSVGRVQTPTLAMIVGRDRAIDAFVPTAFWQVKAELAAEGGGWQGTWFQREDEVRKKGEEEQVPEGERLPDEATARGLAAAVRGRTGVVERAERVSKEEPSPLLYDLTALQRRANQRYGFTADQTLALAQALYEQHKLITYPRTDARHLTPDQVPELRGVVEALTSVPPYRPFAEAILAGEIAPGRRVVNAAEVGDHHALLPTHKAAAGMRLSPDEKRIYDLVARRLLAVLSPDAVLEKTLLVVAIPVEQGLPEGLSSPARFRARGTVIAREGWRAVDPPTSKRGDSTLPLVQEGIPVHAMETSIHEGKTRPPSPYNDASLLKSMETAGRDLDDRELKRAMRSAGLGTPATRAEVIKTLLAREVVVRRGRELRATDKGRSLIDAVPIDELKSAELTGRWEARLSEMAERPQGGLAEGFMADVRIYTRRVVEALASATPEVAPAAARAEAPLGSCPVCGEPVREGRGAYTCDKGRECSFVIFKKIAGRDVSVAMARSLLKDGRTSRTYKGFRSKKGKAFEAGLELSAEGKVQLWFGDRPPADGKPAPAPAELGPCPVCGEPVREGPGAFSCAKGRDCTFVIFKNIAGHAISEEMARTLLRDGRTSQTYKGFTSRQGKSFEAGLELSAEGRVQLWFAGAGGGEVAAPASPPAASPPAASPPAASPPAASPPAASPPAASPPLGPVGLPCPVCGEGRVMAGRSAWGCDRWRRGCTFRLPYEEHGRRLSEEEAVARLRGG
ncbi:MAG: DNA topoisomerase 3 [Deltaproteobacteria bacterium]|nr:DNA topoisomerase 3 [Deltaproteobacteria bacterium]